MPPFTVGGSFSGLIIMLNAFNYAHSIIISGGFTGYLRGSHCLSLGCLLTPLTKMIYTTPHYYQKYEI